MCQKLSCLFAIWLTTKRATKTSSWNAEMLQHAWMAITLFPITGISKNTSRRLTTPSRVTKYYISLKINWHMTTTMLHSPCILAKMDHNVFKIRRKGLAQGKVLPKFLLLRVQPKKLFVSSINAGTMNR